MSLKPPRFDLQSAVRYALLKIKEHKYKIEESRYYNCSSAKLNQCLFTKETILLVIIISENQSTRKREGGRQLTQQSLRHPQKPNSSGMQHYPQLNMPMPSLIKEKTPIKS